jgi:hypothetical protein
LEQEGERREWEIFDKWLIRKEKIYFKLLSPKKALRDDEGDKDLERDSVIPIPESKSELD